MRLRAMPLIRGRVFEARHRKEFACLGLGLLLFGVLLVPLVHAVHVHGELGSGHAHPHSHGGSTHRHAANPDSPEDAKAPLEEPDTHEHGAGDLQHPELLTAGMEPLAAEPDGPASYREPLRPLVAILAIRSTFSPEMPQGP